MVWVVAPSQSYSHRWHKASSHLLHPTAGTSQPMEHEGCLRFLLNRYCSYVLFFLGEKPDKTFCFKGSVMLNLYSIWSWWGVDRVFKCACTSKVVVSNIFWSSAIFGKFSNLTSICFQMGWFDHQLDVNSAWCAVVGDSIFVPQRFQWMKRPGPLKP